VTSSRARDAAGAARLKSCSGADADALIGRRDGLCYPSRNRRGLEDRVGEADRRSRADRARRRPCRGARAGCFGRRAPAVAKVRRPRNPGAWLMATAKHRAIDALRRKSGSDASFPNSGMSSRSIQRGPCRMSTRPSTTASATTSCGSCSSRATRYCQPRRVWRSRSGCLVV
jgi:hypothetical protein